VTRKGEKLNRSIDNDDVRGQSSRKNIVPIISFFISLILLLLLTLWNQFPFVFSDTGTYLAAAINRQLPGDRTVFYSLYIFPLHLKISLWPIVVAQAAVTYYLIRVFFRAFSKRFSEVRLVLSILVLSVASSLPWFVGQIMPDVFSALVILSIICMVLGQEKLGRFDRIAIPVLITLFITTHLSYLLIAGAAFALALLLRLTTSSTMAFRDRLLSKANLSVAAAIAVSVVMMLSINIAAKRGVTFAWTGNVMMLAKVIDQGIGIDYLTKTCGDKPLPVCSVLPRMKEVQASAIAHQRPIGYVSDYFLWAGPVQQLGGMRDVSAYASEITKGAISAQPGEFVKQCLRGFVSQITYFQLGDDMMKYGPSSSLYAVVKENFSTRVLEKFTASKQYNEQLPVATLRTVSNIVLALSVLVILVFMVSRWRSERTLIQCIFVVVAAILVNDFVTGALSAVHDRYGSRVIWLLIMLGVFIVSEFIGEFNNKAKHAKDGESGRDEQLRSNIAV
jgi:hypothetical protein